MDKDNQFWDETPEENPNATITEEILDKLIKEATVSPTEEIPEAQVCLQVVESSGDEIDICTLGNFSLAIGKPKSRKTYLTSLFLSIVTGYMTAKFIGKLPTDKSVGIYFDTEQSRGHVIKLIQRICKLLGKPVPENIIVYSLRKYPAHLRVAIIERVIYSNPNIGFAVIDGVRDLVTSINDEEQATMITSKLLKWTEERNLHIMAVLHQNKGDNNARGHLGAELTNKAETVFVISKLESDKNISTVVGEFCRDRDFSPFAFTVSVIEGLPEIVEEWGKNGAGKEKVDVIRDLGDENIYKILSECFKTESSIKYGEMKLKVKGLAASLFKKDFGLNKSVEIITYCKDKKWVIQEKDKGPYKLVSRG